MLINMLISTNIASTKPTEHIKDMDKVKNKALAHTKEIVQRTHTTEKNTKKAKKIKYFNKKSALSVTN
jgi:hypothetical protein